MAPQTLVKRVLVGRTLRYVLAVIVFLLLIVGIQFARTPEAGAVTSSTINFQARLKQANGAVVPDGYYNAQFKLYNVNTGGTPLWTETYYDSNGVTAGNDNRVRVVNGYLSVSLGSLTAFGAQNWDQEMWITMNIGGVTQTASPSWDGEMSPRLKLTAVPYAFQAGQLAKRTGANTSTLGFATQTGARNILLPDESGTICLQSSTNCNFASASGSGNYIQNGTSPQTADFNITGDGRVGSTLTVGSSSGSTKLFAVSSLTLGTNAQFRVIGGQGGIYYSGMESGDANARIQIRAGTGKLEWGDGTNTQDTNLYRSVADTLKTDDSFEVGTDLSVGGTLGVDGTGASYIMGSLGLGTSNPQPASALTIANGKWITAVDAAGTGYVNMFSVNSSNEIQVGAALNVGGGIVLPTNGGQLTLVDLPIDATAAAGVAQSYSFRVGTTNVMTVYGEADGSGNAQNLRVAIGSSISPQYTLDVGGDINTTGAYRINGTAICTSSGCTPAAGSGNYIQNGTTPQTANFNITGNGTIGGALSVTGNLTLTNSSVATFGTATGDKLRLYSNTYGIGIESSTLTNWSGSQFRWRIGGTSATTGSQYMLLTTSGLSVTGSVTASTTITGTTLNGTTGINTGAGAGTQRIDSSGNLVNIGSITASGDATVGGKVDAAGSISNPYGGIGQFQNIVTSSETIAGSGWMNGGTIGGTQNADIAPDGNTTATQLTQTGTTSNSYTRFSFTNTASGPYTVSIWAKAGTTSTFQFGIFDFTAAAWVTPIPVRSLSSNWQRFTTTGTPSATGHTLGFLIYSGSSGNITAGSSVYVWGAQLVPGSDPLVYNKTSGVANTTLQGGIVSNGVLLQTLSTASNYLAGSLTIGTLGTGGSTLLCSNGGQISTCTSGAGAGDYIQNGTTPQTADFNITGSGTIGGSLTIQTATNSTTALQVQNSTGTSNTFVVDTTNGRVGINKVPTVALDVTGAITASTNVTGNILQAGGSIRLTSTSLTGAYISKSMTTGTGGVSTNDAVVLVNDGGATRVVRSSQARDPHVFGVAMGNYAAAAAGAYAIAGTARVNADTAAVNIGDQLVISNTAGTVTADNSVTTGVLGIALSAKAAGSSGLVSVYINAQGGQDSPVFRNFSDSTAAFQIQNASGTNLFNIDTSNKLVSIENGTDVSLAGGGYLLIGLSSLNNIALDPNEIQARNNGAASTLYLNWDGGDLQTNANSKLIFGTDTNLYRSTTNVLATDDSMYVVGKLGVGIDPSTGPGGDKVYVQSNSNSDQRITLENNNAGAAAQAVIKATAGSNSNNMILLTSYGNGFTTSGLNIQSSAAVAAGSGSIGGLILKTLGAAPVIFGINNSEVGRFNTSGQLQLSIQGSSGGLLIGGDANLYRAAVNTLKTDDSLIVGGGSVTANVGYFYANGASAGNAAFRTAVSGDTFAYRFQADNTGALLWGSGSGTGDTNLYRSAANTLQTDSIFNVNSGDLRLTTTASATLTIEADTDNVNEADNPTIILKQDGGAVVASLGIDSGNDLVLQNNFNSSLKLGTNGSTALTIQSGGQVSIGSTYNNGLLTVGTNTTTANGGLYLGSDTNLYRSAANTLNTGGNLQVTQALTANYIVSGNDDITEEASMGALQTRIVMQNMTVLYGTSEPDTKIYKNGALIVTAATPSSGTFSASAGDLITTNSKPAALMENSPGRTLPALGSASSYHVFYTSRYQPHPVRIYAPNAPAKVDYYNEAYQTGSPAQTIEVPQGQVVTLTLTSEGVQRFYSTAPIVMTTSGTSGDDENILPASHETVGFNAGATLVRDIYASSPSCTSGNLYCTSSSPMSVTRIGDGDGADTIMDMPYKMLGDTYIIPHSLNDFGITSVESNVIRVYIYSGGTWTLYGEYDHTAASRQNPVSTAVGPVAGGTSALASGAPTLVVGKAPFYLRTNHPADRDEYAVIGYRQALRGGGSGSVDAAGNFWTLNGNSLYAESTNYNLGIGTSTVGAKLHVQGTDPNVVTQIIQGSAAQAADILQLKNSVGDVLSSFDATGNLTVAATGTSSFAGNLTVGGTLSVTGASTFSGTIAQTTTVSSGYISSLVNQSTNNAAGGLSIRVDQNLISNILLNVQTGASGTKLQVLGDGSVRIGNASNPTVGNLQILNDNANATSGILFGSTQDTNLYRSAANTLQTDDSFVLNGTGSNLTVGGTLAVTGASSFTDNVTIGTSTAAAKLTVNGSGGVMSPLWSSLSIANPTLNTHSGGVIQNVAATGASSALGLHVDSISANGLNLSAVGLVASRISSPGYAAGLLIDTVSTTSSASPYPAVGADITNVTTNNTGNAYGLRIANVSNASANTGNIVSGITIENSISNVANTSNAYAFRSLSTAQSLFAGAVTVQGAGAFTGSGTGLSVTNNATVGGTLTVADAIESSVRVQVNNPNNTGAMVQLSWVNDIARLRYGGTGAGSANGFQIQGTGNAIKLSVGNNGNLGLGQADNTYRLSLPTSTVATGGIDFGGDTNLYRTGTDALRTDDALTAVGGLTFNPATATGTTLRSTVGSEANPRFNINYGGVISWGAGGGTVVDTNLYRSAANTLKTDDNFYVTQALTVVGINYTVGKVYAGGGTANEVQIGAIGPASEAGIRLGLAGDTTLYRSAASTLQTDGSFVLNGTGANLTVGGTLSVTGKSTQTGVIQEVTSPFKAYRNLAAYNASTGTSAGAFVIETNVPIASNTMTRTVIEGYFYDSTGPFRIEVGGYMRSTGDFLNRGYVNTGAKKVSVRFGSNAAGNGVIILGETTDTFPHPKLAVTYFLAGHSSLNDNYGDGWTISQKTDLSAYSNLTTVPDTTTISDGSLSSNVALLNRNSQTFTGNNQLFKNASDSATAFQIQNAAGAALLTADTSSASLIVGTSSTGVLKLLNNSGTNTSGILFGSSGDVNLYRSAANILATDDGLLVNQPTTGIPGIDIMGFANNGVPVLRVTSGASPNTNIFAIRNSSLTETFTIAAGGSITQSGAASVTTGSGAIALNGNVTVASGKTLTVAGTGATTLGGTLQVAGTSTLQGSVEASSQINTPFGGFGQYSNLLTYSEQFENAAWARSNVSAITANTVAAPNGQTVAESATSTANGGYVYQNSATAVGSTYTFSVWLRAASGTQTAALRFFGTGTGNATAQTYTLTTTWQRYTVTSNTSGFTGNVRVAIYPGGTGGTGTVYAWGAQMEAGSNAGVYTAVTSATLASALYGMSVNGQTLFSNAVDSTTAFQIQNSANITLLGVDTTNSRIFSGVADGASAIAFKLDTSVAYSTSGAKLISIQNNGSEKFSIDKNGHVKFTAGAPSASPIGGASSCGVSGNDVRGQVWISNPAYTTGGCRIYWANSFSSTPYTMVAPLTQAYGVYGSSNLWQYGTNASYMDVYGVYSGGAYTAYYNYWNPE